MGGGKRPHLGEVSWREDKGARLQPKPLGIPGCVCGLGSGGVEQRNRGRSCRGGVRGQSAGRLLPPEDPEQGPGEAARRGSGEEAGPGAARPGVAAQPPGRSLAVKACLHTCTTRVTAGLSGCISPTGSCSKGAWSTSMSQALPGMEAKGSAGYKVPCQGHTARRWGELDMKPPGPRATIAPNHQQAGKGYPQQKVSVSPSVTKPAEHLVWDEGSVCICCYCFYCYYHKNWLPPSAPSAGVVGGDVSQRLRAWTWCHECHTEHDSSGQRPDWGQQLESQGPESPVHPSGPQHCHSIPSCSPYSSPACLGVQTQACGAVKVMQAREADEGDRGAGGGCGRAPASLRGPPRNVAPDLLDLPVFPEKQGVAQSIPAPTPAQAEPPDCDLQFHSRGCVGPGASERDHPGLRWGGKGGLQGHSGRLGTHAWPGGSCHLSGSRHGLSKLWAMPWVILSSF